MRSVQKLVQSLAVSDEIMLADILKAGLIQVMDCFPDYMLLVNADHKILVANKAVRDSFQMTPEALVGLDTRKLLHGVDGEYPGSPLQHVMATGEPAEREYYDYSASRWYATSVYPTAIRLDDGSKTYLHIIRDITERKESEEALAESEALYRSLLEIAPTGIVVHQNGVLTYANMAAARIMGGSSPEELTGRSVLDFVHPSSRDLAQARVQKMVQEGATATPVEEKFVKLNGDAIAVRVAAMPVTVKGKPAIQVVFTDITEEKAREAALKEQKEALEMKNLGLNVLNQTTASITQTIDLEEMLTQSLAAIMGIELFALQTKGGVLLLEGDKLELAYCVGASPGFIEAHRDITVNDCLCGLAIRSREVVISTNSHEDEYHTISYDGMQPHGHVIVPLVNTGETVGALYLYVPVNAEVSKDNIDLLKIIGHQLAVAIDNSRHYEKAKFLSLHDALTGLANRKQMKLELGRNLARAHRTGSPFSVIMMDLDHFKNFNDSFGHDSGDKLLVAIANIIRRETREMDLAVRYGGEEFFAVLPDTGEDEALEVAERIRNETAAHDFETGGDPPTAPMTISLGVATFDRDLADEGLLVVRADTALYQAKQDGRNCVRKWV